MECGDRERECQSVVTLVKDYLSGRVCVSLVLSTLEDDKKEEKKDTS